MIHDLCREVGYWAGLAAEEHYDREFSAERETYQRLAPLGPWLIDCARTRMAWLECETAYQRRVGAELTAAADDIRAASRELSPALWGARRSA